MDFHKIIVCIIWLSLYCMQSALTQIDLEFSETPRILTKDGHLVFMSAESHNITFRSSTTGYINLNGEDLMSLIQLIKDNKQDLDTLRTGQGSGELLERLGRVEQQLGNLEATGEVQQQLSQLSTDISTLTNRVSALEQVTQAPSQVNTLRAQITSLNNRVNVLNEQYNTLNRLLRRNECNSSPCQNGGTCTDIYNGFFCMCPPEWQGETCSEDVNECVTLSGTDRGCQNGATCTNSPGSFSCACTANWYGVLCSESHDDCTGANSHALCDHGTCVNIQRTQPNQPAYRCICDSGWTTGGGSPACSVDVNECDGPGQTYPCSGHPYVQCVNLPGTFRCLPCPAGYTGDGRYCTDVNECEVNNGGCSIAPRVQCTNTVGSRTCGPCPPGFTGDSVTCTFAGICSTPYHGCHPLATCVNNEFTVDWRTCQCPPGYIGNGVGPNGCVSSQGGSCANNPCQNGATCLLQQGNTYVCQCAAGWQGFTCSERVNACASSPCLNGGSCSSTALGGFSCACAEGWTGLLCQERASACGGVLVQESGTLRYPTDSSQSYPHGVSCAWTITTAPNLVLTLNFSEFKLEQHASCDYDFLEIHDGATASAHQIGKFCGDLSHLPNGGIINSTHHQLYLWFKSDASNNADGFQVHWTSTTPLCGGTLEGVNHGAISSPGYPGNYPHNRDCSWQVAVEPGNTIQFHFAALQLESHPNCSYDYLKIYDGFNDGAALLGSYCSSPSTLPAPLSTTGPYARVSFHSDENMSDSGFHITYSAQRNSNGCGGHFEGDSGIIQSPNFPNNYPHDSMCIWTVTAPENQRITVNFTNMNVEDHESCVYDHVEVRSGSNEDGDFMGRFCGSTTPVLHTQGNQLWVKFRSDSSSTGSGFRIMWQVECGGLYTSPTGQLISPYFPDLYPNNKECVYRIEQPVGSIITLQFLTFDVETSSDGCAHDALEVRNGGGPSSPLIGQYCGTSLPGPFVSQSYQLWLKFRSDASVRQHGFNATYTVQLNGGGGTDNTTLVGACGGSLTDATGTFTSPGHPQNYPNGINCTWYITVDPSNVIRLTFPTFHLESHDNCAYDAVTIADESGRIGRFCGANGPPVLTSTSNRLVVTMETDSSVVRGGFTAHYESIDASQACGGLRSGNTGIITSPDYPSQYPHNRDCEWTLTVAHMNQIRLNITDLRLEHHESCEYDYLELRNGGTAESPLIGRYCGLMNESTVIVSHSNRVFIKFHSDGSSSDRGFKIFYDGTTTGCGGELTAPTGSIISPNYPLPYAEAAECFWTISVSPGNNIILTFDDLNMEGGSGCTYDYLMIREQSSTGALLGKFCGSNVPTGPLTSRGNVLWLKFKSDYSASGRGFSLFYETSCNVRLTAPSGVIESPNFPQPYPHAMNCTYTIETTSGNSLNVQFTHFHTESNDQCSYDYLQLFEGQVSGGSEIGRYCGDNLPPPVHTSSNIMVLRFLTDDSVAYSGFRLQYATEGCGSHLAGIQGTFSSLNYPNQFPPNRACMWTIEVPEGQQVQLSIHDLNIGDCPQDALLIYGGIDISSVLLSSALCNTQTTTQVLTATGNHMTVYFSSNSTFSGRGFNASFTAVEGGCGGNFSSASGHISSPDYPNSYPHNTDCVWSINVDPQYSVRLIFNEVQMEQHENCAYDYIAIYDGVAVNDLLLDRVCQSTDRQFVSSGNHMTVRMRSDSSVSSRGFNATYTQTCGGRRDTATDGVIMSPNFPQQYQTSGNCTWYLYSSHPDDRVTLTFTDFHVPGTNCSTDYIRVLDGDDLEAPERARLCGTNLLPSPIVSQGSALVVTFVADGQENGSRFQAVYTKSTTGCGGMFYQSSGTFNSPRYPDAYPNSIECIWEIQNTGSSIRQLVFSTFDLGPEDDTQSCSHDYVEIRANNASGALLGRFCGQEPPVNATTAPQLWIKFVSDGAGSGIGFQAQFSTVYGGAIFGERGMLMSPHYPNNYDNNAHYTWDISVAPGLRVALTFIGFYLEYESDCDYDYVAVYDGVGGSGSRLGKYCGSSLPSPVASFGNGMRVVFHADGSETFTGFQASWVAMNGSIPILPPILPGGGTGCGGILSANTTDSILTSPNYPATYPSNIQCVWQILAPEGFQILFNITDFMLERHNTCSFDYLEIYAGEMTQDNRLRRLCGTDLSASDSVTLSGTNQLTVKFRTDSSSVFSGFQAKYKSVCGGRLTDSQGAIELPSAPGPHNCTWNIQVTPGRQVQLTTSSLNIPGQTGQCSNSYITFYNGEDISSPVLGQPRYCGSVGSLVLNSSYHEVTVRFYSAGGPPPSGSPARIRYEERTLECGGLIVLAASVHESGFLLSPNYPDPYPVNTECIWTITAANNEQVQLDFPTPIVMERHHNCTYDFVEIHDGPTENAEILGRFCDEETPPSTLRSSGSALYVHMRSDHAASGSGFRIAYRIATCGGMYSSSSGFLESENYPSNYEPNMDCEWYIRAPTGHYLSFTFLNFVTESNANCLQGDYLQIKDYNQTGTQLALLCGSAGEPVNTSDSFAYLKFHSNGGQQYQGFRITYNASVEVCGGTLTTPTGTIASPNYPGLYPHSRNCVWHIEAPSTRRVTLTINDLNIEEHNRCLYDFVAVFNGRLPDSPLIGSRLCGEMSNRIIQSTGPYLTVQFRTDGSVSNGGFMASYTTNSPAVCGGSRRDVSGTIQSPGFSGAGYNSSMECIWTIEALPQYNTITVQFNTFSLERHGNCLYDHVEIREGTDATGWLIGRYCGNYTSLPSVRSPHPLWIRFVSDTAIEDTGFQLSYSHRACGGVMRGRTGAVKSPNYPNNYSHNDDCVWLLEAAEGARIRISFADISIEEHPDCEYDYVEIFNGGSATSPSVGRFCGTTGREPFLSQSNQVRIEWHSDDSNSNRGFGIDYTFVQQGCGGLLHDREGQLSSPNWPQNYPRNYECVWEVEVPAGYHIEVTFTAINIQADCGDYVQVDDYVNNNWHTLGQYCGQSVPTVPKISLNKMRVKLHTDAATEYPGFSLNYTTGCGGVITDTSGSIVSPGYPLGYESNMRCNYTIIMDPDQFVMFQFTDLFVEGERNKSVESLPTKESSSSADLKLIVLEPVDPAATVCMFDSVRVYAGNTSVDSQDSLLGQFCGTTPPQILSAQGSMHILFVTDDTITDRGWKANFWAQECGGTFHGPSGEIHTPTHPLNYHHNANCTWLISVDQNRIAVLKFDMFELEGSGGCEYDLLSIYDGGDTDARLIGKFCGREVPEPIRASTNQLFLLFESDSSVALKGFHAAYYESFGEHQGCGGLINATADGSIRAVDIDGDGTYEAGQDCEWRVVAPADKVLRVSNQGTFSVETSLNCTADFLEMRDGFLETDPIIGRFCGRNGPNRYRTSSNALYVRFVSDDSVQNTGFTLNYTLLNRECGGALTATANPQNLTSPNYPGFYPHNLNCRWVINAPPGDDYPEQVQLQVHDMHIEDDSRCSYDYLELRDQPLGWEGQSLHYCNSSTVPLFTSVGSVMQVNFRTDSSSTGRGFSLSFQIAPCNRTFTHENGRVTSPGWPGKYRHSHDCYTRLRVAPGRTLALYFNAMAIEGQDDCPYDFLQIFNGTGFTDELAKLCGRTLPNPIFINSNEATLRFRTDGSVSYEGFDVTYTSTNAGLGCGGSFTSQNGTFTSPGYPGLVVQTLDCTFNIQVQRRHQIRLEFDYVAFSGTSCTTTSLVISSSAGETLLQLCGDEGPRPAAIETNTNNLTVRFRTDAQVTGQGFRIIYTS